MLMNINIFTYMCLAQGGIHLKTAADGQGWKLFFFCLDSRGRHGSLFFYSVIPQSFMCLLSNTMYYAVVSSTLLLTRKGCK